MGLNLANQGADAKDLYKMSAGMHIGVVDNFELAGGISIQPGVYYAQKNWKMEGINMSIGSLSAETEDIKFHTHYIEVPVLVKYNLEVSDLTIDPHVGPYFGFGFAGKIKDSDPSARIFSKPKDKHPDNLNYSNFDMGLDLGCGVTYASVYFGIDYQLGFKDVAKTANLDVKNRNLMFTFGVWFE